MRIKDLQFKFWLDFVEILFLRANFTIYAEQYFFFQKRSINIIKCRGPTIKNNQCIINLIKETWTLKKMYILVQIQAATTGFLTFYWSGRAASPLLIQWTVRINWLWQLGPAHKIHIRLEAIFKFFCIRIFNVLFSIVFTWTLFKNTCFVNFS